MIISFSSSPKLSMSFANILLSSGSVATKLFSCSSSVKISYSVISISEPSPSPTPFGSAPFPWPPGWLALFISAYLFSFSISLLFSYYYTISFSKSKGTFSSMSISRFFLLNLLLVAKSSPYAFLLSSNIFLPSSSSMSCLLFTRISFVIEFANGFLP